MLEKISWTKLELKKPVVFKESGTIYIVRKLINNKGVVMAELEVGKDSYMRQFKNLPSSVQGEIERGITAQ